MKPKRAVAAVRPTLIPTLAALLATVLAACAPSTPRFERYHGSAVRAVLASQIAHPGAAGNTDPAAGVDGASAAAALARYQQSFAAPAPHASSLIGGGGGGQ